jgi:hypothetical protein
MVAKYTINNSTWTAISAVGTSGSCWLDLTNTQALCVIDHSTTGSSACDQTRAFPLTGNIILPITADSASDIFYALALSGTSLILSSDTK